MPPQPPVTAPPAQSTPPPPPAATKAPEAVVARVERKAEPATSAAAAPSVESDLARRDDVPPPLAHAAPVDGEKRGARGWLIGLIAVLVVVVVGGAAAFAYFKFAKPAPQQDVAAASPAVSAPASGTAPAPFAPNDLAPVVSAMAGAAAPASEPVASAPASVPAASANVDEPAQPEQAPPPPVDHTLKIAADLVSKGERAYSQGDYERAVRHARSALDVRAGYAPAERLLKRAYAAQKQVSEQQAREQQRIAAEQQRAQAAQAAAAVVPKGPTPDEIYNQRAHSECARGLFGKSCRHKIRVAVCEGVKPGSPGSTVCTELKD